MQHARDSAVLSERILTDKAPQERRAGIIADSARIGKAAQDVLRLRRVCNAREAGIAVEDDRRLMACVGQNVSAPQPLTTPA